MKQKLLLKSLFLLCALIVGTASGRADDFELYSGELTEGDYLIVYNGNAMKNTVSSNRLSYESVTITNNTISTTLTSIVWHIAKSGDYYTLYNADVNMYAASTSEKNQATLVTSVTDNSKWTVTGASTYNFENKARAASSSNSGNKWLRNNGTYGFACYSSSTGDALSLYKKKELAVTSISIKTAPSKTNYKIGENLSYSGLVLSAVTADGSVDVTSGYTTSVANGTTLNTAGNQDITITYAEKTTTLTIKVGELSSLTYNDADFTNTSYTEKDKFNKTGLEVTAHYSNDDENDVVTEVIDNYTLTPNVNTELKTTDTKVTVSYSWAGTTKTVDIPITVIAGTKYTVSFAAEAGTCETTSLEESEYMGGVTLPSATINMAGWVFAGWATSAITNTITRPTLFDAGTTYYPTSDITLHAVYTLETVEGSYEYTRATTIEEIIRSQSVVIVTQGKVLDNALGSMNEPAESNGEITATDATIWAISGNNSNGYTFTNNSLSTLIKTLGISNMPSSNANLALSTSNNKWLFVESENEDHPNEFIIRNTNLNNDSKVGSIQYHQGKWKVYCLAAASFANNASIALKIYVPKTAYNSNPTSAIATPNVTFNSSSSKTLYLDGTITYTNAATVTGIAKSATYSSSNTDVATVNATTGEVTAIGIGTATITASVAAELGVNKYAADTYDVVVKNTTNIAGIKNLVSTSTVVDFSADLTDAVVTYVNGNYAYIQDATAAIMVNASNHGLTAGKKINGAVSGKVKAPYQMDQITMITVSEELTDADVPAAEVKTLAQIAANATYYDGKKVTVNAATATDNGLKITDDNGTTKFSLETPKNNITINETEIGNYTGFVSIYVNGDNTTYRLNLYEEGQYVKTQNQATDQILSFDEEDVQLDEETSTLTAYRGETVKGAFTTVTYSVDDGSDDIIDEFNAETGVLKLNGSCGMAIINVSAAAENIVSEGVTTPYNAANASYTITVNPRYSVVFSINGVETTLRQDTHGAAINVPTLTTIGTYNCVGWSINKVAATNDEPSFAEIGSTVVPSDNNGKYYAVFAIENKTTGNVRMTITPDTDGVPTSYGTANTFSEVTLNGKKFMVQQMYKNEDVNNKSNYLLQWRAGGNSSGTGTMYNSDALTKLQSIVLTYHSSDTNKNFTLKVGDSANPTSGTTITPSSSNNVYTFDCSSSNKDYFVLTNGSGAGYLNKIEINYEDEVITYSDYRTSIPPVSVTVTSAKYATFSNAGATDFSQTGIKVYKAKVENEVVRLTEIEDGIVPAKTGVILYSETAVTTNVPFISNNTTISENELVATYERTLVKTNPEGDDTKFNYIMQLSDDGNSIVFNKAITDGAYMPAGRAYLCTSTNVTTSSRLAVVFGDDASGIEGTLTSNENVNGEVYNLKGQRVMNPTKGNLYIVNGKKVFIK